MIVQSILDTDFYKLTMQAAVLEYMRRRGQPITAKYTFIDRRPEGKFNQKFADALTHELKDMESLRLGSDEADWLMQTVPFLGTSYIEWLRNYRFNKDEVSFAIEDGKLRLTVEETLWGRNILWEVPLMATISELYFRHCDTNWSMENQGKLMEHKSAMLGDIPFADFGTRRRRTYGVQDMLVQVFKDRNRRFVGTSNVHLAMKHGVKPIGTQAHEWYMAISALEGLRRANYYGMKIWSEIFGGRLGIALTDTFGTDAFFQDFDVYFARLFDGVRHDSGDPFAFAEKTIAAYEALGISPKTRTIVFSDNLNCELVVRLYKALCERINVSFGIGTHFTNHFLGSKALNMVIKLILCNGIPVVKLGDDAMKQLGERDALRVANWTFRGIPLDAAAA